VHVRQKKVRTYQNQTHILINPDCEFNPIYFLILQACSVDRIPLLQKYCPIRKLQTSAHRMTVCKLARCGGGMCAGIFGWEYLLVSNLCIPLTLLPHPGPNQLLFCGTLFISLLLTPIRYLMTSVIKLFRLGSFTT
jgi:hypothetical protein